MVRLFVHRLVWCALLAAYCSLPASAANLTAVSLVVTPPSPQPAGISLTLTATPTGGTTVEYLFGVWYSSNGTLRWLVLRNYATNRVFVDRPPITGTFTYEVRAREQGSTTYVNQQVDYTISSAPTGLTAVSLDVSPPSPQPPGTQLTLTATPTGGTNVEYLFGVRYAGQWLVLRNYSTNRVFVDQPPITGTFTYEVRAREQGTTTYVSDQEVYTIGSAPPPAGGQIAFISNRDGNDEVYIMNADGSSQTRLTNNTRVEMEHAWRPDGGKLVFVSERDGTHEIYTMNPDGSSQTRITNDYLPDWGPTYSPDGTKIYFFRTLNGTDEIYVMNANGSSQVRLTNNPWFDVLPVLTPDGSKIVFDTDRNGSVRQANYDIYVMNPDGSRPVQLTNGSGREWYHAVSPNGQLIAYTQDNNIRLMNIDGSNQRAITTPSGYQDKQPIFSPDGSKIAFASNRDGDWEIYIMNLDGSGQRRITNNTWKDEYPAWRPE
ncbi:MAG: TolB family protein [Armatimonadota bacterium]